MGPDDSLDLAGFSLHWTRHSIKAVGCYTEKHGPIDFDLPTLAEGYYDGAKVQSPWYDREVERRADDPAAVAQELDIAFLSSGHPVFKPEWSRRHLETVLKPVLRQQPIVRYGGPCPVVEYEERESGELWWYEDPDAPAEQVYTCGVDASEGLGNLDSDPDYNGLVIWDPVLCRPAAVLRSRHLSPADVAAVLADLASRRDLLITIERNGPGLAVISTLSGLLTGYRQEADVFYPLNYADARGTSERQPGFRTTAESKHQLVELIRYHTNPDRGALLDRRLVDEYTVFAHLSGRKMGAPAGTHDDLVMALGLALVAAKDAPVYEPAQAQAASDDAVMAGLAQATLDGSMTDEQVFQQLGLR